MRLSLILLVVLASVAVCAARQKRTLLVRMNETELSIHPTAGPNNISNCLVIATDGHAHLELRRQEVFNGHATEVTYSGTLNAKQVDILRTILQDKEILSLPRFVTPTTPMRVDSFHAVSTKIYSASDVHEIGYFEWQGKAPENDESVGESWSRAATAMKPLVEWFHSLKSTFPWKRVSNPTSGVCGE